MLNRKMGEQSSSTLEEIECRLNSVAERILELQRQVELVDTPRLYEPNRILVTDSLGQIVDSGMSPQLITKMRESLIEMAEILRSVFIAE